MNRYFFAQSWGRKIFFGISWPISTLLLFAYLQSHLFPVGVASWIYFVCTAVALSGLLHIVLYFGLFYPVVSLLPGYYPARIWSLILILATNGALLADVVIFGQYRFHINPLIIRHLTKGGITGLFPSTAYLLLIGSALLAIAIFIWMRGERLWRRMQKRFSNPVSNWYFFLIVGMLAFSHLLYRADDFQKFGHGQNLAGIFPLNYQSYLTPSGEGKETTSFRYPTSSVSCSGKAAPHVLFLVLEGWKGENFSEEVTPFLYHLPEHGTFFESHYFLGRHPHEGLFGLLYGLPAIHRSAAIHRQPYIFEELKKRGYEFYLRTNFEDLGKFHALQSQKSGLVESFSGWSESKSGPIFTLVEFSGNQFIEIDTEIKNLFNVWHQKGLLQNSVIVITGSHSSDVQAMPLIVVWNNRRKGEWSHQTTHYDVVPTLLQEVWNCKLRYDSLSEGKSLFLAPERKWEIFGNEFEFLIWEPSRRSTFKARWNGEIVGKETSRVERLYLEILRHSLRFYQN